MLGKEGDQVFKLRFHTLKPLHPVMQDQVLPTHPCAWWLFLCPSPSRSRSPSRVCRWSPEPGLGLTQQKHGLLERERGRKNAPAATLLSVTSCPPWLVTRALPPASHLGPQACGHPHPAAVPRSGVSLAIPRLHIPGSQTGCPPPRAPENLLLPTVALMSPTTTSKDQPLK